MGLDGIARVDTELIPDHVLVDYDGRSLRGEALADIINELSAARGRCHAAVMESCITAGRQDRGAAHGR